MINYLKEAYKLPSDSLYMDLKKKSKLNLKKYRNIYMYTFTIIPVFKSINNIPKAKEIKVVDRRIKILNINLQLEKSGDTRSRA